MSFLSVKFSVYETAEKFFFVQVSKWNWPTNLYLDSTGLPMFQPIMMATLVEAQTAITSYKGMNYTDGCSVVYEE